MLLFILVIQKGYGLYFRFIFQLSLAWFWQSSKLKLIRDLVLFGRNGSLAAGKAFTFADGLASCFVDYSTCRDHKLLNRTLCRWTVELGLIESWKKYELKL